MSPNKRTKKSDSLSIPDEYPKLLKQLKERIRAAQLRAAQSVNSELVLLYWNIGNEILTRQNQSGWGSKVVDQLSTDLRREFPDMKGFSTRNLKYMRAFADAWPDEQIVQQAVAQIPWGHNVRLLDKVEEPEKRLWYAKQTLENGWSRDVLLHQIDTGLCERQGQATTNFDASLPTPQSDLANQLLKDPYNFEFLTIANDAHENELQKGLLANLREFMLELGVGFAYVGSQVHLDVGGDDFYIDLLFYHLKLRCYVVIDLKTGKFKPEYAGKMNFYLAAVDDLMRHEDDRPSIGLILCREKNKVVAEYSLRDMSKPIGVPEYKLTEALPEELASSLPTVEQLESELKLNDDEQQ
jgi:predicted nuclease of restriction endonuclease-like (RecB) superfamily